MTLESFVKTLNELIRTRPETKTLPVITAKDEEGNGYDPILYLPSVGKYDKEDNDFLCEEELSEGTKPNAVCVN